VIFTGEGRDQEKYKDSLDQLKFVYRTLTPWGGNIHLLERDVTATVKFSTKKRKRR
jgi:hypothetical protein